VFFDVGVDVLLDRHLLGDGLYDDVGVADRRFEVDQRRHPVEGRVGVLLADLVLLGQFVEGPLDAVVAVLDEPVVDIAHPDVVAGQRRHFGDAVAHVPGAEYRDGVDVIEIHVTDFHSGSRFNVSLGKQQRSSLSKITNNYACAVVTPDIWNRSL